MLYGSVNMGIIFIKSIFTDLYGHCLYRMKKSRKIITGILLALIALPGLFILLAYCGVFGHLKSGEELLNYKNAEASVVLSAEGRLVGKFYAENRTNITYQQLPRHLIDATIATEDARFFKHEGVDSRSLLRVLLKTLLLNRSESGGGSTITQQLAKNMFGRKGDGTFSLIVNKTREAILARRIEKTFSKEEILTLYLNTVSFGENIFGIEAAASRYFNKKTETLKIEESATLIGMLKATTRYNPALYPENATTRRNVVIRQMEKYNYLPSDEADSLCKLQMTLDYRNADSEGTADYFLVWVKNEVKGFLKNIYSSTGRNWDLTKDGLIITTTLNLALQTYANKSFSVHLPGMQKKLEDQFRTPYGSKHLNEITGKILEEQNLSKKADDISRQTIFNENGSYFDSLSVRDSIRQSLTVLHAGLLAIDPVTGAIRAWTGGIDFNTQPYDQILARRQLGSVFKPLLYALAFEEGMEPCQYLDNDSLVLEGYSNWSPENFDHSTGGKYSLAGALSRSMNIPTFSLFIKLGFGKLDSLWRALGFSFPLNKTPALALGTAEASIEEIAVAYSAFANGGFKINPWSVESIIAPDGEIIYQYIPPGKGPGVLTERSCTLISAILQKAIIEGTGASLRSKYGVTSPIAGKTGTSQNYADAWFAAFNPKLTIVARAGASSPAIHFDSQSYGTGSSLALPLVALTLKMAESDPETRKQFFAPFPVLSPELVRSLDCPDFKNDNFLDKLMDIFNNKEIIFDKEIREADRKKKSLFKRIFRR